MANAGDSITFAPQEMHRFWNAGDDDLVGTGFIRSPDNLEYFLTQIYASIWANGGKRPRLFAVPTSRSATAPSSGWVTSRNRCSEWCSRSWWP